LEAGFVGFVAADDLRTTALRNVPKEPGVYIVTRETVGKPLFSQRSCGGHFKGKDPTVSLAELESNWVNGAIVIYIGKAGGGSSKRTLRKRLSDLLRFGAGKPVGHWGGRLMWQLENVDELRFCWRVAGRDDALEVERQLIREFTAAYGARPFANLRD